MARSTIIDWQRDSLLVVQGEAQGEQVRFHSMALVDLISEGETGARNPQTALARATARLNSRGSVTILASRELVEMRTLQIPKMDVEELPDIIRFQAQRQFTSMTDAWIVDFVMLPQSSEQELQTALVAAMSPTQVAEIDSSCAAAGMQVDRILLRPLEVARLAVNKAAIFSADSSMLICVSESTADILLLRHGQVVLVRTIRLPQDSSGRSSSLQSEIRRSLLAGATELNGKKVESAILIASDAIGKPLVESVQAGVQAPVSLLTLEQLIQQVASDPSSAELVQQAGSRLAAVAGVLLSSPGRETIVDFKHPKKRQPKKKNTRTLVLSVAAGAAVLLLVAGWYLSRLSELNSEFEQYSSEIASRQDVGKAAEARIAELRSIERFLDSSPNWLDELSNIAQKMPPAQKIKLGNPNFSVSTQGDGIISLTVRADEASSISEFEQSLRSPSHTVSGSGAGQLQTPDENYRWSAQSTIAIKGRGWKVQPSAQSDPKKPSVPGNASEPLQNLDAESQQGAIE